MRPEPGIDRDLAAHIRKLGGPFFPLIEACGNCDAQIERDSKRSPWRHSEPEDADNCHGYMGVVGP